MNATAHQETGSRPIYLDHNATTPIAPVVAQAMWPCIAEHFGNPSSSHHYGRVAKAAVDHAREQVAALIGAQPDEIIFTSGCRLTPRAAHPPTRCPHRPDRPGQRHPRPERGGHHPARPGNR